MKRTLALLLLAGVQASASDRLLEPMKPFVAAAIEGARDLPPDRVKTLVAAAERIAAKIDDDDEARLMFICTHNSRRSHLSQVWAQAAAHHYQVKRISTYSGGTEATACNFRTVRAMRGAGLSVSNETFGDNPVYLVQYAEGQPPLRAYSKRFGAQGNPSKGFLAMMCCADADDKCPLIAGADGRVALHYLDPKSADNTPHEAAAYDERNRQIAAEMFFLMSQVKRIINT